MKKEFIKINARKILEIQFYSKLESEHRDTAPFPSNAQKFNCLYTLLPRLWNFSKIEKGENPLQGKLKLLAESPIPLPWACQFSF